MVDRAKLEQQLTVEWDERGIDADTVAIDSAGTIMPPVILSEESPTVRLPKLASGTLAPFELGATIGEGGRGVVRSANQRSLEREVAVKSMRANADDAQAERELLREARVTGTLEHPNVVPIHALGHDERGRPMIVMKRIEGTSWAEILDQDVRGGGLGETLDRHLDILVLVARATHFAHVKGILHRDLKPQNVMIGSFGEVYLVDWGIAVALHAEVLSGLPIAGQICHVAGTPEYMAPEMAAANASKLGVRSDVFLLGSILHQLLSGGPPHTGDSVKAVLFCAYLAAPLSYPPEVPKELAAICRTAMEAEPEQRFESAEDFAQAIEQYQAHRSSLLVAEEAGKRLAQLEAAVETHDDRKQIYAVFNECRFGFAQALRMWDGNQEAQQGLQHALTRMIRYELDHGSARAAAALLPSVSDLDPQLEAAVERALERAQHADERIARLERDKDVTIGDPLRSSLMIVQALAWLAVHVSCGVLTRREIFVVGHFEYAALNAVAAAISAVGIYRMRKQLYATEAARRLAVISPVFYLGYAALFVIARFIGMSVWQAFAVLFLIALLLWSATALLADRRVARMALVMAPGFAAVMALPSYVFEITGASGVIAMLWLVHAWRKAPAEDEGVS